MQRNAYELENPFEKIEELLTCAICLDRYKHPKVLPCQHSFCLEPCLEGLIDYSRRTVKCPECRVEHVVPHHGVQGLPTNYTLVGFLEIHLKATDQNAMEFEAYTQRFNTGRCQVCNEKVILEICAHCKRKVCPECLENHSEMVKRDLNRLLTQVKRISARLNDWSEVISQTIQSMGVQAASVKMEIKEWIHRLVKQFKNREEALLADVEAFYNTETRTMKTVCQNFEHEYRNICEACARLEAFLKGERHMTLEEAMFYKQMFIEGLEHLRIFSPDIDAICNKRLRFVINTSTATLANMVSHFGEIQMNNFSANININSDLTIPRFLRFILETEATEINPVGLRSSKFREENSDARRLDTSDPTAETYEFHRHLERASADISEAVSTSPWSNVHVPNDTEPENEDEDESFTRVDHGLSLENSLGTSGTGFVTCPKNRSKAPILFQQTSNEEDDTELNMRIANIRKNFELRKQELDRQIRTIKEQNVKSPYASDSTPDLESGSDGTGQEMEGVAGVREIAIQIYPCTPTSYSSSLPIEEPTSSRKLYAADEVDRTDLSMSADKRDECADDARNALRFTRNFKTQNDKKSKLPLPSSVAGQAAERDSEKICSYDPEQTTGSVKNRKNVDKKTAEDKKKQTKVTKSRSISSSNSKVPLKRYTYTENAPKNNYARKGRMILKFGHKGNGPGELNWPRGVALTPNGKEIVICDSSNHRLQIFDIRGKFIRTFGKYGNNAGQYDSLAGVCVNQYGQIVVTDRYNHRIQMLELSGRVIRTFGSHGQTNGRFNNPWGVTMDAHSFIYVCDKDNHRVQVFSNDGTFLNSFGTLGSRKGQFQHPHFIATSRRCYLIVSDTNNHRIQVFDNQGKFLFSFGSEGYHEGQFKYPKGVAVDDQEFIFVADSGNSRVQIFYPDGRFFAQFGTWGSNDGEMRAIEDVAVTKDGLIVVSDRENHRVQIF